MTDKVYTQQELKEMADQLLAADDKKKAGKPPPRRPRKQSPRRTRPWRKSWPSARRAALLVGNEKLRGAVYQGQEEGPPGAGGAVRGGGPPGPGRRPDGPHL